MSSENNLKGYSMSHIAQIWVMNPHHRMSFLIVSLHLFLPDRTYTGCVSGDRAEEGKTQPHSDTTVPFSGKSQSQSDDSTQPVWRDKDLCPVLSLEGEQFTFVSGFAKEISG